jgi:hypothetical protein
MYFRQEEAGKGELYRLTGTAELGFAGPLNIAKIGTSTNHAFHNGE